jgi:murein DD-endopeptidase MepM/ murein hydrolase activator NlpD
MSKKYRIGGFSYQNQPDYENTAGRRARSDDGGVKVSVGYNLSIVDLVSSYMSIRIRQFRVFAALFSQLFSEIFIEFKSLIVRNMYWGRTSFYKSSFHIIVILITFGALYSGFDARIASSQRDSLRNIRVSDRIIVDSDVVSQQGSLFPLEQLDEESDGIYANYTVKSGDSLAKIAQDNAINENTIRWANGIPAGRDTLSVGQVIKIPKVDGVLYSVKGGDTVDSVLAKVQLKDKDADKLTFLELNAIAIDADGKLIPGSTVILYDASIPLPKPIVARPLTRPGGGTTVNPGSQNLPSVAPGTFVNPMQLCSYSYSRGYSTFHTGVDLATNPGCWIVAAGAGVVARTGQCNDLGYCVVIKHAGGYSTIYGHGNGVIGVSVGQQVSAGQKIMQSGCTGRCFGPHLHLSMTINNQDVYGCYRCRVNPRGTIPY